jgi:endonuclease/exonuclease/phosphatase family metal-dependent hydrolase
MAYNIFEYASGATDTTNRNPYFRSIINNINPDILVGIEIEPRDDDKWAVGFLDKVLNGGSSNGDYSMGTYVAITNTGANNDNNVIYYKHSIFTFLTSQVVVQDGNHPTLEFKLRHNNTFEEIIIYGIHFSSTNSIQRNDEAIDIRALTDNFTTENFIAAGDFNLSSASEAAYGTLINNSPGNFLDPESFANAFNTFNIRFSQSSFDERYDLILNSQSVVDAGGVEYVSGSFVVDGNDGFGDLNNVPVEYIAASDHLPIYADYLFGNPTPVELAFFTGSLNENNVELRWRTETEVNNYGFYIERTTENSDWITIGFVEGFGNSNSPKHYNYNDIDIYQSANYNYRLKQTDNDGTFEYSDVVTVTVGVPVLYSLSQNYPNPFNPQTRIDYTLPEQQNVSLRVYNMLGELVQELVNEVKPAGTYTITFNASSAGGGLSSGIYVYVLKTPAFVSNRKMTFLK